MTILVNQDSKLAKALGLHPDVLEYIISLNPHDFERLRNPLMRRAMPPRISLARIATMTNTPILELLERIHEIAESPLTEADQQVLAEALHIDLPINLSEAPTWIEQTPVQIVDLLAHDANLDADPMPPIMKALKQVQAGEVMLVKHMWEPQPLYDIWSKTGVAYYAVQQSPDEWWIYLRKID